MVNPVQGFSELSTPKKVAVVAGTAAAVGSLVYAAKTGKVADEFQNSNVVKKAAVKVGDGYKRLGGVIVDGAKRAWNFVKDAFSSLKARFTSKGEEAAAGAATAAATGAETAATSVTGAIEAGAAGAIAPIV